MKLRKGQAGLREGTVTLAGLFARYEKHRIPQKGEREQKADARRIKMLTRVVGADTNPKATSAGRERALWRTAITGRDARRFPKGQPDYSGTRTVKHDCRFVLAVLNWAVDWRTEDGYLLNENVCRGYPIPQK